jgi:hypothetical protein
MIVRVLNHRLLLTIGSASRMCSFDLFKLDDVHDSLSYWHMILCVHTSEPLVLLGNTLFIERGHRAEYMEYKPRNQLKKYGTHLYRLAFSLQPCNRPGVPK